MIASRISVSMSVNSPKTNLEPKVVPPLDQVTAKVAECFLRLRAEKANGCFHMDVVKLIAKYAMERFEDEIFGTDQWNAFYGVIPVSLPSLLELRGLVKQHVKSTSKKLEKDLEKMSPEECANFLGIEGIEEHPVPSEKMYECLNTRVRPNDKRVAGVMCAVTFIPEYVRTKEGRVVAVTSRILALSLGPNPAKGQAVKLADPHHVFITVLTEEDADQTQPSCYFVMEKDVDPATRGKKPSDLIAQSKAQVWKLPEPRNFKATVLSRCVANGQFLYSPWTHTYSQKRSKDGSYLGLGGFGEVSRFVHIGGDYGDQAIGASGSRKFRPVTRGHV